MYEGWGFVLATYLLVAATLVLWFWMILAKLARAKQATAAAPEAVEEQPRG